jgi:hypothetical protein
MARVLILYVTMPSSVEFGYVTDRHTKADTPIIVLIWTLLYTSAPIVILNRYRKSRRLWFGRLMRHNLI